MFVSVDVKSPGDRRLVYSQILRTGQDQEEVRLGELGGQTNSVNTDQDFDRMVPLIIIFSCLTTVLVFVMIIVTLVKRSAEYSKSSSLQTHVAFNKNLDKDIEPDILNHTKQVPSSSSQGLQKVYSLDQLNQVSFEGFTSLNPSLMNSKYNTLPGRPVGVEQVFTNQEQTPLLTAPRSILVKKVTFEKESSEESSNTSTPTLDLSSYSEQYLDMGQFHQQQFSHIQDHK